MVSTSGSRRRSTTFEALTNPCSSAIIMIFSHTSLTYQARARDHAGSLANFGSLIHSGICITPPDKKSDGGAQSLKAGYGIIRWRVGFSLHFSKDLIWNDLVKYCFSCFLLPHFLFSFRVSLEGSASRGRGGYCDGWVDHSDIRGSKPHNRDPSGAASD